MHRPCLAEIRLRMSRRMRQRHEHLAAPPLALAHVILDDRVFVEDTLLDEPAALGLAPSPDAELEVSAVTLLAGLDVDETGQNSDAMRMRVCAVMI